MFVLYALDYSLWKGVKKVSDAHSQRARTNYNQGGGLFQPPCYNQGTLAPCYSNYVMMAVGNNSAAVVHTVHIGYRLGLRYSTTPRQTGQNVNWGLTGDHTVSQTYEITARDRTMLLT